MKKIIFITLFGILFNSCSTINEKETRNLERFDKVNLVGSVELHLERNSSHSMEIMAKNASDIADLITEVRNGELYIYNKKDCDNCKNPKYIIYLNHIGISELSLTGKIKLISDNAISQKDLVISGNGILNGNLEVSVNNLSVDLNGISNMHISGDADTSNLKITGIGMINAFTLKTKSGIKVSKGIAFINK
ncbi:DUF2807 domain-containing protein [Arenibacter sp. F26102]|uniref:GIN domain-containing protein n=1 Tax=Arenibacter sp. F26102 TaxID=2926416 RepID=UPI001FF1D916|nr:DUF2807 domain-containing protein [Arenibacter sp. F26102]MCK0145817.1 DUF2807 domain-containing protein [Arenibacter sp. F26102]